MKRVYFSYSDDLTLSEAWELAGDVLEDVQIERHSKELRIHMTYYRKDHSVSINAAGDAIDIAVEKEDGQHDVRIKTGN